MVGQGQKQGRREGIRHTGVPVTEIADNNRRGLRAQGPDRPLFQLTYLLGTRFEILQRISYGVLLASSACSSASTLSPSPAPSRITSSPTATPGIPVTSTSVRSIEMRPTIGA